MEFAPTRLPEVVLIKPRIFADRRGYFLETWQQQIFAGQWADLKFVQDNHSHSVLYTLRGLHYQIQQPQGKLVRVARGEIFDVAVDIRRRSPRFGQAIGVVLSESNHDMLWVPPGFAHGYLALTAEVDVLYKCTDYYAPLHERAICWNDAQIGVNWPLPPGVMPVLSVKDAAALALKDAECYP